MKNRIELTKYFAGLRFKIGAEIGVWDGRYSEILCQNIPGLKLYAIDCWKDQPGYKKRAVEWEAVRLTAKEKLKPYGVTILEMISMEAVKKIADSSLDFVFIDAGHDYNSVRDDIREWDKKVRKGGIVSGHDYYVTRQGNVGVINAVDEYVKEHCCELKLTDWDRENPVKDDRQPSWYFIKA